MYLHHRDKLKFMQFQVNALRKGAREWEERKWRTMSISLVTELMSRVTTRGKSGFSLFLSWFTSPQVISLMRFQFIPIFKDVVHIIPKFISITLSVVQQKKEGKYIICIARWKRKTDYTGLTERWPIRFRLGNNFKGIFPTASLPVFSGFLTYWL